MSQGSHSRTLPLSLSWTGCLIWTGKASRVAYPWPAPRFVKLGIGRQCSQSARAFSLIGLRIFLVAARSGAARRCAVWCGHRFSPATPSHGENSSGIRFSESDDRLCYVKSVANGLVNELVMNLQNRKLHFLFIHYRALLFMPVLISTSATRSQDPNTEHNVINCNKYNPNQPYKT